jgi:UDP-3-O-[3-hydroxymyristoyl] glucosamine N-acyltransferase
MKLKEIASRIRGRVEGDGEADIKGVAGVKEAREDDIAFLLNRSFEKYVPASRAGAIVAGQAADEKLLAGRNCVIVENPALSYVEVARLFEPRKRFPKGESNLANISPDAFVSPEAAIFPYVYVDAGAVIEKNAVIHPFCFVGRDARIGEETILYPNVSVYDGTIIGKRVIVHAGSVLGADGFGYVWDGQKHRKIPQLGMLEIGDDVEIGANTCIDRASLDRTAIMQGTKIDNLVQIGHNVIVGEHSIIVSQVGVAGSATLGKNVVLGGKAGVRDHVVIGDNVRAAGGTGITKNVKEGAVISGTPHMAHRDWLRLQGYLKKLPELFERIDALEEALRKGVKQ